MEIKDLTTGMLNVTIEGIIIDMGNPRDVGRGKELWVADATLEDMTGKIKLTLWNNDIEKFKIEDKIKVTNGYIKEFNKEKQLSVSRNGEIEKVS